MLEVLLERDLEDDGYATFGRLVLGNVLKLRTLELPWKNNERGISCIPEGVYECKPFPSHRFGMTWEVTRVPDRSAILFHKGNYPKDTRGCILVGSGVSNGMLTNSSLAMKLMREIVSPIQRFRLTIVRGNSGSQCDETEERGDAQAPRDQEAKQATTEGVVSPGPTKGDKTNI